MTPDRPTVVDRGFQLAYRCAYRAMRTYWKLRHPVTSGALVALWHEGEVLLVRNSYVPYYVLPGGYIRRGETARDAARRELAEEVGVSAGEQSLALVLEERLEWEGKRDHVFIFALELGEERPPVHVDHREVVEASWWPPSHALSLDLFPPVRHLLEKGARSGTSSASAT